MIVRPEEWGCRNLLKRLLLSVLLRTKVMQHREQEIGLPAPPGRGVLGGGIGGQAVVGGVGGGV